MEENQNVEIITEEPKPQKSSKSAMMLLIIGAVVIALAALVYLIFQISIFVEVINVQPDPEATIDPEGINNAAYVIITIISTIIATIVHVIGTAFSAIGLVLNGMGQKIKKLTIWGVLQIVIPFVIYVIGFLSIFIIQHV